MHPQSSKKTSPAADGRNAERRHADDPDQRGKRSINYGTPDEKPLEHITVADAKKYIAEGQFGENSMLPKMEAAVSFLEKASAVPQSSLPLIPHSPDSREKQVRLLSNTKYTKKDSLEWESFFYSFPD